MEESDFRKNLAIVGLGMIGGSYAMALRQLKSVRISGIDIDENVLNRAADCGIIDEGAPDAKALLRKADMVIIALYPRETIEFIKNNAGYFKKGAIVTDTCGIKKPIIDAALEALPENVEFIGGHPMAGNELQGFSAASKELFVDTNYIITPHEGNSERGISAVEKLVAAIGCKCVTRVGAEAHDHIISLTSQLPHIIAVSFANLAMGENGIGTFVGRSFMDATRVAALNKELWTQIFMMNSTYLIDTIESLEDIVKRLKNYVRGQDEIGLRGLFENAVEGKRELGK
ncbi:MAG: prephenate dehydrogenase [Clostridiaceae bacterium]|nr:prephenate dehydrogenase [Clostridiaceae bacterium]